MTQKNEIIDTSVAAQTGLGPTTLVAIEQYFPAAQRIIHDDLAQKILPTGYRFFVGMMRVPLLRNWMVQVVEKRVEGVWSGMACRKRYIDNQVVLAVTGENSADAVVNLGAGYDTRVYRLPALANVPVWEVDQPVNIEGKQRNLQKALGKIPTHVTLVPINFIEQELATVLKGHGYAIDCKTFFIWEAVSQYLTETAVRQIFDFLAQTPAGSRLAFTYVLKDFIEGKNLYGLEKFYEQMIIKNNAWHFGLDPAEVADFLGEYGWHLIEDLSYEELNNRYAKPIGRNLPSMKIEQMAFAEKV